MAETLTVYVNGRTVSVPRGATAAVAILLADLPCRTSVSGDTRGPLCGMGTCFECRVDINGEAHQRSCQVVCVEKMEIRCYG